MEPPICSALRGRVFHQGPHDLTVPASCLRPEAGSNCGNENGCYTIPEGTERLHFSKKQGTSFQEVRLGQVAS